jgi:hypothetical protein
LAESTSSTIVIRASRLSQSCHKVILLQFLQL